MGKIFGWALAGSCALVVAIGAIRLAPSLRAGQTGGGAGPATPLSSDAEEVRGADKKLGLLRDKCSRQIEPTLAKLRADREDLMQKLSALGVTDSKSLKENFKAQS